MMKTQMTDPENYISLYNLTQTFKWIFLYKYLNSYFI